MASPSLVDVTDTVSSVKRKVEELKSLLGEEQASIEQLRKLLAGEEVKMERVTKLLRKEEEKLSVLKKVVADYRGEGTPGGGSGKRRHSSGGKQPSSPSAAQHVLALGTQPVGCVVRSSSVRQERAVHSQPLGSSVRSSSLRYDPASTPPPRAKAPAPSPAKSSAPPTEEEMAQRKRTEEREFFKKNCSSRAAVWYIVDRAWLDRWETYARKGGPLPGPISNEKLLDSNGQPLPGLKLGENWRAFNEALWEFWLERHGGGPALRRCSPLVDLYGQ